MTERRNPDDSSASRSWSTNVSDSFGNSLTTTARSRAWPDCDLNITRFYPSLLTGNQGTTSEPPLGLSALRGIRPGPDRKKTHSVEARRIGGSGGNREVPPVPHTPGHTARFLGS